MFFEGRGMQKQTKIYQIPDQNQSKKHCQFQGCFLPDFNVILESIWAPFGHPRPPFAE